MSLIAFLVLCSAALRAQAVPPPPVDLTELQRLGSLTPADQRRAPNQAALRRWFQHNVEVYRHAADGTILGRSTAVFNPGPSAYPDMLGAWGQIWGPFPDLHHVVWDNRPNPGVSGYPAPLSWVWPPEIGFGLQGGKVSAHGGLVNTCWHEGLHAILGQWDLDELDLNAFQSVRSGTSDQEVREHAYINWAERTIDWIAALREFENLVRAAAAEQERYQSNGVPIDWAIEHYIWRNAWVRWSGLQAVNFGTPGAGGGKITAAMTPALRDRFLAYTGIRVPLRDEVIRFYMTGGVTNDLDAIRNSGTRIRVPEWVLVPDYRRARMVQLKTTPAAPTCRVVAAGAGKSASCTFGVDLTDTYSTSTSRSVRAGVARGTLRVSFFAPGDAGTNARELADPDARVVVRLAGQDLGAIARRAGGGVEIDLPALYRTSAAVPYSALMPNVSKPIALDVEFVRGKVELLKADKQYGLSLRYRDADNPVGGPAVYYDAEAIFFITIHPGPGAGTAGPRAQPPSTGGAQPAPPRATQPPTAAVPQPTTPGASAARGPGWHLVNTFRRSDPLPVVDIDGNTWGVGQERGKLSWFWEYTRTEESSTSFAYTMLYYVRPDAAKTDMSHVEALRSRRFTWTSPPSFIPVNGALNVHVEISAAGSAASSTLDRPGLSYVPTKISEPEHDGISYRMDYLLLPPDRSAWDKTLVEFSRNPFAGYVRGLGSHAVVVGSPGDYRMLSKYDLANALAVVVETESRWDRNAVVWQYEYRESAAQPPASVEFTRQADAVVEKDADIDNEPPALPPPPTPPPTPRKRLPAGAWYTHPTGDWRIWLRSGSQVSRGTSAADFDDISAATKGMRLRVWRGSESPLDPKGRPVTAAQALSSRQAKLLADFPGSTVGEMSLGAAPAIVVERSETDGERLWEYWFAWNERMYRADFVRSVEATLAVPALPGTSMLGTIEFLRSRQGSGVPRPPAAQAAATTSLSVDPGSPAPAALPGASLTGRGDLLARAGQSIVSLTNDSRAVWTKCTISIPGKRSHKLGSLPAGTGRDYAVALFKPDASAPDLQGEALVQCAQGSLRFPADVGALPLRQDR